MKVLLCGPVEEVKPIYEWELLTSFNTIDKKWITVSQTINFINVPDDFTNLSPEEQAVLEELGLVFKDGTYTKTMLVDNNYVIDTTTSPSSTICPYDNRGELNKNSEIYAASIDNIIGETVVLPSVTVDLKNSSDITEITNAYNNVGAWMFLQAKSSSSEYSIEDYNAKTRAVAICDVDSNIAIMLLEVSDSSHFNNPYPEILCGYVQSNKHYDVYQLINASTIEVISSEVQRVTARPQKNLRRLTGTNAWNYVEDEEGSRSIYVSWDFDLYGSDSNYNEGDIVPADYENPIDNVITIVMANGTSSTMDLVAFDHVSSQGSADYNDCVGWSRMHNAIKDDGLNKRWYTLKRIDTNQIALYNFEVYYDMEWGSQWDMYFPYADQPILFSYDDHHKDVELEFQHFMEVMQTPTSRDGYYVTI